jgi:integrase/recombinase XerD
VRGVGSSNLPVPTNQQVTGKCAGLLAKNITRLGGFMLPRFQQFSRERQMLMGVSPATLSWYKYSLMWLNSESPSQDDLKDAVIRMRVEGLKATGCNSAIRAINAYLHWNSVGSEAKCSAGCCHLKIPQLKEPQLILPTFSASQVKLLVNFKPKGFYERRLHLMVCTLFDTGARISEVLGLNVSDIDLDNLLLTLDGKGSKQRRVPFSFELRKVILRYATDFALEPHMLLLSTRRGLKLDRHIMLRDVKRLCVRLGFTPPARTIHATRHTFAINYLRKGGSVFHLQRVLGHSTLEMTRRYCNVLTEDLQGVHQKITLLAA